MGHMGWIGRECDEEGELLLLMGLLRLGPRHFCRGKQPIEKQEPRYLGCYEFGGVCLNGCHLFGRLIL